MYVLVVRGALLHTVKSKVKISQNFVAFFISIRPYETNRKREYDMILAFYSPLASSSPALKSSSITSPSEGSIFTADISTTDLE